MICSLASACAESFFCVIVDSAISIIFHLRCNSDTCCWILHWRIVNCQSSRSTLDNMLHRSPRFLFFDLLDIYLLLVWIIMYQTLIHKIFILGLFFLLALEYGSVVPTAKRHRAETIIWRSRSGYCGFWYCQWIWTGNH